MRLTALPLLCVAGCTGMAPMMLEVETVDRVVRPSAVVESSLPTTTFQPPTFWKQLLVADTQTTLVGSDTGLYELTSTGLTERSDAGVTGLLPLGPDAVLVANDQGLFEWRDGLLRPSLLDPTLRDARFLARHDGDLFFARDRSLLRLRGTALTAIDLPGAAQSLDLSGSLAVITSDAGHHLAELGDMARTQPLDDERPGLTAAVPFEGDVLALGEGGALLRRMQVDAGTVWRPVALSTNPADPGATQLTFLHVDSTSGAALTGNATTLFRLQGDAVTKQPLLAPLRHLQAAPNGGVWGLSLDGLTRIGRANPVTFEPRIATLSQVHCARCHAPSRQAAFIPLLTVADWRSRIDAALDATTPTGTSPARMPADTLTTLTDDERALLRQWKEDGLQ